MNCAFHPAAQAELNEAVDYYNEILGTATLFWTCNTLNRWLPPSFPTC